MSAWDAFQFSVSFLPWWLRVIYLLMAADGIAVMFTAYNVINEERGVDRFMWLFAITFFPYLGVYLFYSGAGRDKIQSDGSPQNDKSDWTKYLR